MAEIEKTLGKKEAKRFKKEVNSLAKDNQIAKLFGKRINLKREMNKCRVRQCQTLQDSIEYTMKQIQGDIQTATAASKFMSNNNDLYASGGPKNFFRRQGNKIKAAKAGAPLLGDEVVQRGARTFAANGDAVEGIKKIRGIYGGAAIKSTENKRQMMKNRVEIDYDIADYNKRTRKNDFSAQSLPSFITGADRDRKRKFDSKKRINRLDDGIL